jgi:large subunit ribosomal protein L22
MSRARAARKPELGELIATAQSRFNRVTARKARSLADLIRGLTVAQAEQQLANTHKPSAMAVVSNALKSAVANAKDKEAEDPESLVIGEIFVDAGPMLKRFQPRAMGRACSIRKRMSHVTVKLYTQA